MSLDKLAIKIAKRDEKAFGELYERMRRLVYSVCLGVVKDFALAEELTQDTFVTAWTRSEEFRGCGYKKWLLTVAKNKSINELKKRRRETLTDFLENEEFFGADGEDERMETHVILTAALEVLDETDRQIVLLRNAGMKAKEIAEFLEMPRGTVSWRYAEGIRKLREWMEERE